MKVSIYNVIFPYDEHIILYNTLHCESMLLDKTLSEFLNGDVNELENLHPEFYQALLDGHFIVDESIDEVEEVEQLRLANLSDKTQYHLTINPTLDCNFHCWYCYESKVKGSEMSVELVKSTIAFIENVLLKNKDLNRFHLYFFGGEPLLKYDKVMRPILDAFVSKVVSKGIFCTLQITTNGALLSNQVIEDIKNKGLFTSFQITFDGYGENHNRSRFSKEHPKSYEMLIDTIKVLIRNGMYATLRVNYTHKNVEDLRQILNEFIDCSQEERGRIIYTPVRIWQDSPRQVTKAACEKLNRNEEDGVIMAKSNETVEYAMSLGMQTMPINSIDSVRYPCKHSYVNAASINYNGDVFKCCARSFDEKSREGVLQANGEIIWRDDTNDRILRKRTDANESCKQCIIFPICGGGCVQSFNDFANTEYCLYQYDEASKIEAVKRLVQLTQM